MNDRKSQGRGSNGRRTFSVHPNSIAATKLGRSTWTTTVPAGDLADTSATARRSTRQVFTTRDEVRIVACPICHAAIGDYCRRKNGRPRLGAHGRRHTAAVAAGARPVARRKPIASRRR